VADQRESAVQVAIARAASNYSPHEWFELPSSQRTRAIYRELQLLDAAASGRLQEVADQAAPVPMRKSRLAV
jgi:hypothetical protein